jgi:hypothetical protein
VYDPPAQVSGLQLVPALYLRQPPAPSHVPSLPQLAAPRSTQTARGSAAPAATAVQVPGADANAQLWHAEVHALSQQTPSTQNPLAHSAAAPHECPLGLGPQLPFWHDCPVTQSASLAHRSTQEVPMHR